LQAERGVIYVDLFSCRHLSAAVQDDANDMDKPSFLWMMYRAGWGCKEAGQHRILAVDVLRSGFDWVLRCAAASCLSPADPLMLRSPTRA